MFYNQYLPIESREPNIKPSTSNEYSGKYN